MTEKRISAPEPNELLNVLMHVSEAAAIYQGDDIIIRFANDAMLNFWGKGPEVIGKPIAQAIPELEGQPFEELLKQVWKTGKTYEAQSAPANLASKEGIVTRYFDYAYKAILDEHGKTQWILNTAIDVSERIRHQRQIKENRDREVIANERYEEANRLLTASDYRMKQLIMSSPVGLTLLRGKDFIIEMPNNHMLRIWGRDRAQVEGMRLLDVFPELIGQPFPDMLLKVLNEAEQIRISEIAVDIRDIRGVNRKIYVNFAYEPLFNGHGEVEAVMVTVVEITDVVNIRKELEDGKQKLQELVEALEVSNEEYQATNEELNALNEEFAVTNEELQASNDEVKALTELLTEANTLLTSKNVELNQSLKKVFAMFEDSPAPIALLTGRDLIVDTANPEILRLWGKTAEVIGKPLAEAVPELKGQQFLDLLDDVFTSGKSFLGKGVKALLKHGDELQELYFNFTYKALVGQDGKTHSILVVANEVTDQVKSKQQIEEAFEQLNFALEVSKLGAYELDLSTQMVRCNANCRKDLSLDDADELSLDDFLRLVPPVDRKLLDEHMQASITSGKPYQVEFQTLWPDGSRHWIETSGNVRYNEDGSPSKLIGLTANITEQKAFDQRKDDFLSIASHELKTPVTTLRASLQMLGRIKDKLANPMAAKLIETSLQNMERFTVMIDNLLNINRLTQGQMSLDKRLVSLRELLDSCCSNVKMDGKHDLIVSAGEIVVMADKDRIDQVITNFVNNAVKYAASGKEIYLSAVVEDGFAKISVKDTGPGIPVEQQPHLFERYWRADHSGHNYSGLGLGLFICAEIIRAHGGQIGVESKVGDGATFWFTLPLDAS
jgi:PAS domain S-box-containing protein